MQKIERKEVDICLKIKEVDDIIDGIIEIDSTNKKISIVISNNESEKIIEFILLNKDERMGYLSIMSMLVFPISIIGIIKIYHLIKEMFF
ncbi:hypothetical protein [Marininema halotolerans]|uniref:Uncharacterized protein n=1 Tax=Marininema halotolerans TaxID=1155944 RepID=A0A1I6SHN5_9BACL|nr:hypothetical protein [Marininema halotolerans]SFS76433.1 hypothetical protein SAMN05444972_10797 [Marininema halotolerans]